MVSVAGLLAADTSSEQLPSDALLQIWHRLRLAVLHSIWTASQIAQASQPTQPSDTSEPDAILASSPSSQQASLSSSSTSRHGHLARQLALKTVKAMIHNDLTKCNDNIKQISGVCSSWLRGKDPSMTLAAFQSLRCHNGTFFFFFFLGYREDVHSMQAARPTKIPDEPMLCETPASSRSRGDQSTFVSVCLPPATM